MRRPQWLKDFLMGFTVPNPYHPCAHLDQLLPCDRSESLISRAVLLSSQDFVIRPIVLFDFCLISNGRFIRNLGHSSVVSPSKERKSHSEGEAGEETQSNSMPKIDVVFLLWFAGNSIFAEVFPFQRRGVGGGARFKSACPQSPEPTVCRPRWRGLAASGSRLEQTSLPCSDQAEVCN
jgi:hypothetical protein